MMLNYIRLTNHFKCDKVKTENIISKLCLERTFYPFIGLDILQTIPTDRNHLILTIIWPFPCWSNLWPASARVVFLLTMNLPMIGLKFLVLFMLFFSVLQYLLLIAGHMDVLSINLLSVSSVLFFARNSSLTIPDILIFFLFLKVLLH